MKCMNNNVIQAALFDAAGCKKYSTCLLLFVSGCQGSGSRFDKGLIAERSKSSLISFSGPGGLRFEFQSCQDFFESMLIKFFN